MQANGEAAFQGSGQSTGRAANDGGQAPGLTGFELPPLPDAGLPLLPGQTPGLEIIPLAEVRVNSAGASSRAAVVRVLVALVSPADFLRPALAAWKLLNSVEDTPPPPPAKPQAAAVLAREVGPGSGGPRERSMTCRT